MLARVERLGKHVPTNGTWRITRPASLGGRPTRRAVLRRAAAGIVGLAAVRRSNDGDAAENLGSFGRVPTIDQIRSADPSYWILVDLINEYRGRLGLSKIALSPRLTVVAALHVRDLATRAPHADGASLHSWSRDDRWSGGQYKPTDKSSWTIMWDKPKEIVGYPGYGFEIAAARVRDARYALEAWQKSPQHSNVMLNRDTWADDRWQWKAIGAAFFQGFACAWFGDLADG